LFVRAFERGERVYLAMASRGYEGSLPETLTGEPAKTRTWAAALTAPAIFAALTATAWATV
jgi:cobalt/nickel transport system permease protein